MKNVVPGAPLSPEKAATTDQPVELRDVVLEERSLRDGITSVRECSFLPNFPPKFLRNKSKFKPSSRQGSNRESKSSVEHPKLDFLPARLVRRVSPGASEQLLLPKSFVAGHCTGRSPTSLSCIKFRLGKPFAPVAFLRSGLRFAALRVLRTITYAADQVT